jgi:DNA replication protein DnaC
MVKKIPLEKPRDLSEHDCERMGIPRRFWSSTLDKVQPQAKKVISRYLSPERFFRCMEQGVGLILCGKIGVGKTAIASICLRYARSYGYTAYFTTVTQLREALFKDTIFENDQTVLDRCRTVDVLLVDDLRLEDLNAKGFGKSQLLQLFKHRTEQELVTHVTTRLDVEDVKSVSAQEIKHIHQTMLGGCSVVIVRGDNLSSSFQRKADRLIYSDQE